MPSRRPYRTLAILLVIVLGVTAMAATFTYVTLMERQEKRQLALAGELRLLAHRLAMDTLLASEGDEDAFDRAAGALARGERLFQVLDRGDAELPPLQEAARPALTAAQHAWRRFQDPVRAILDKRPEVLTVREYVRALNDFQPELSALLEAVSRVLLDAGAPAAALYHAGRQALLAQRIATGANRLLSDGPPNARLMTQMEEDLHTFQRSLQALLEGGVGPDMPSRLTDPRARTQLEALAALFDTTAELIRHIIEQGPALQHLRQERRRLDTAAYTLDARLAALGEAIGRLSQARPVNHLTAYLLGGVVALLFLVLGLLMVRDARRRFQQDAERHRRQREAINALAQELHPLGEGDLTIRVHPRDPLLAPIAEAIEYAVGALRALVTAIDRAAGEVAATAEETQATALHLRRASRHQSEQIKAATETVVDLARDSDNVHREAVEAMDAARAALHDAGRSNEALRECRMELRDLENHVQRTAKRIERLGEGAQQIGGIVELIGDIADQTNILALNAAIHATGNAPLDSEFAHIADEVQQLAERTHQAAGRIEVLAKGIQTDAQEAITAMEQSRERLTGTVRRAEWAGTALLEIQGTVARLADWVEAVAHVAREQAASARHTAKRMEWIHGVALRNQAGAEQTGELAHALARQAQALRQAVAGFRRSEDDSSGDG